jgi:DNA repair exonuclease SbcCD nuclease subunit
LVLAGDIFDSNKPSYNDIHLFYTMISALKDNFDIRIIAGNHDDKIFTYLPEINYTYYNDVFKDGDTYYVPWNKLEAFLSSKSVLSNFKGSLLLTHARCAMPPFIEEEVSFSSMSKLFDMVILGDIHQPHQPYENIWYTSSPSQIHYKTYTKNSYGFIVLEDLKVKRVFIEAPARIKISVGSAKEAVELLDKLDSNNRYKLVITDTIENLQLIKNVRLSHVIYELIPIINKAESTKPQVLYDEKLSVKDLLLNHVRESYKYSMGTMHNIHRRLT